MNDTPDSRVHGPKMGPVWGRQGPGGPHVFHAICDKQKRILHLENPEDVLQTMKQYWVFIH